MESTPLKIIIVDDEPSHAQAIRRAWGANGAAAGIRIAGTLQEYRACIDAGLPDIALLDLNLPDGRAVEALSYPPETGAFPILIMTSYGSEELAVEALKAGALDYVVKSPEAFAAMPRTVARVLREWQLIQERQRAESARRESEEKFRAIANYTVDWENWFGPDGRLLWVNPAVQELTGYSVAECAAMRDYPLGLIAPDHQATMSKLFAAARQGSRGYHQEFKFVRKDGTQRWGGISWQPIFDDDGQSLGFRSSIRDITEQKQLEAQLLRTQRLESVGRLASGVAHDLNNILLPILLAPSLIRPSVHDPFASNLVDIIETSARRGADILKQLLTFSRGMDGQRAPLQLRAILGDMEKIMRETFPKNIEVCQALPAEPWLVDGDVTQLHQVVMNLCVNARDAMPAGGKLTLGLENAQLDAAFAQANPGAKPGRYVILSVADTGTGIAPEILDKIFDPFFSTKEVGKGTGLGLATVLGIAKSHGGIVRVQSQPGRGTRFQIYLPATASATDAAAPADPRTLPQGHGEQILLVDDEENIRQLAKMTLEDNGYKVLVVRDGAEGLARYLQNSQNVQLVVTDLLMPLMDGPSFIRNLRQANPRVKIIAISGHSSDPGAADNIAGLVQAVLPKPFSVASLLQTVHRVLHPARTDPRANGGSHPPVLPK